VWTCTGVASGTGREDEKILSWKSEKIFWFSSTGLYTFLVDFVLFLVLDPIEYDDEDEDEAPFIVAWRFTSLSFAGPVAVVRQIPRAKT
jgi:hypothetical protein